MENKNNIKIFLIKLISITFSIVIILNVVYNLFLAERLKNIDNILSLTNSDNKTYIKEKIRNEIRRSLQKEKIIDDEDKVLLYKFYKKVEKEFSNLE